ncbi:PREDICTED: uncharacterized protein LOC105462505 [Wasmannia auropunctata]|uniref:uncharacterized protein LOC105462505 n=1 Tax=Wasmannia auropunctata TaxID=64793 RepID=UPI0005ED6910|nr:PREDICTED: uncharacterized protein LOC105462505 [Wasmannia auropunctata]
MSDQLSNSSDSWPDFHPLFEDIPMINRVWARTARCCISFFAKHKTLGWIICEECAKGLDPLQRKRYIDVGTHYLAVGANQEHERCVDCDRLIPEIRLATKCHDCPQIFHDRVSNDRCGIGKGPHSSRDIYYTHIKEMHFERAANGDIIRCITINE